MSNYAALSDEELSSLLSNGDQRAYEQFYQRYFRLLYTYAYKKLRDEEQAKDILQEFFTDLWHKRQTTVFNSSISGYFFSAVNNRIINHFSRETIKSKYIESFSSFLNGENDTTDHLVRENQLMELIEAEIQALPIKMRQVFKMSRKLHLSNREIADQLEISERTVETQVSNALYRLRTKLSVIVFLLYLCNK